MLRSREMVSRKRVAALSTVLCVSQMTHSKLTSDCISYTRTTLSLSLSLSHTHTHTHTRTSTPTQTHTNLTNIRLLQMHLLTITFCSKEKFENQGLNYYLKSLHTYVPFQKLQNQLFHSKPI